MTKIAQLHNGAQIHFPDETPDENMDAVVRHHLSMGQSDPKALASFTQAMKMHVDHIKKTESEAEREKQALEDTHHKTNIIAHAAHVEATKGVADAMSKGLQDLLGPVSGLADAIEGNTPELIVAVNKLSDTIVQVGKAVVDALHAPKEIYSGPDGKPKGTRTLKGKTA